MTLFVHLIAEPVPAKREKAEPAPPPQAKPVTKPGRIIAAAPVLSAATDFLTSAPLPAPASPPVIAAPAAAPPAAALALATELAVACPDRPPPAYPALARRLAEEGTVVLQVDLDETGLVAAARVYKGSGFSRLDAAALSAVNTWRCTPALRHGMPVKASALQSFKFILKGS